MEHATISKARPLHKSMDYHFLREEGIRHIQQLAGSIWTDYNSHDPGITLLEILCYAITDLGYRTRMPVEDLLAGGGESNGHFHTIPGILPCNSVTLTDLRKLIIDTPGIRNAWVETVSDEDTPVKGLYDITLELEDDLNLIVLKSDVEINTVTYNYEITFPFWDEVPGIEVGEEITNAVVTHFTSINDQAIPEEYANDYYAELDLNNGAYAIAVWIKITSKAEYHQLLENGGNELDMLEQSIIDALELPEPGEQVTQLISDYWQKIQQAVVTVEAVKELFHRHRNLCEDINSLTAARVQEISISADIDLTPDADANQVLGEIYYRIDKFLSPRPYFYTLEELLDKGRSIESIFEGPLLRHGFLDTEEVAAMQHRYNIYTSDLLQLLTGIPGLISVRDLRISNYYNNDVLIQNAANCLKLTHPGIYKPRLSPEKSEINIYKDYLAVATDLQTAIDRFEKLKNDYEQKKKAVVYDLSPPRGENRETEDYYSIQHHFPPAYGIGSEELPASVPDLRKAQALQLKGYLIFFEQLLADYCSQLAHVTSLFSMKTPENGEETTYFSQSLRELIAEPEATPLLGADYETHISGMAEPPGTGVYHNRKNRFLDHLMARFCESFTDYALFLSSVTPDTDTETAAAELIADKVAFLQDYPLLGYERFRAFNYLAQKPDENDTTVMVPDVWDTENVSGLKKRIVRKLGLESYERRHLFLDFFIIEETGGVYRFYLDHDTYSLESAITNYATAEDAEAAIAETVIWALQRNRYQLTDNGAGADLSFELWDDQDTTIAAPATGVIFETDEDRENYIQGMIDLLSLEEGFHLIEHLLLWPKANETDPDPVPAAEDPYSFRISFILPLVETHKKLGDPGFRQYIGRVIRSETPAHIIPHLYWVNIREMYNFELLYKRWLEARISGMDIAVRRNELVEFLNVLTENS